MKQANSLGSALINPVYEFYSNDETASIVLSININHKKYHKDHIISTLNYSEMLNIIGKFNKESLSF